MFFIFPIWSAQKLSLRLAIELGTTTFLDHTSCWVCLHEHYLLYCLRPFLLYDQIAQSPRSLHDYGTSVVHLEMVFLSVLNEAQISL